MSLLLKALDKASEEEKKKEETSSEAAAAQPASASSPEAPQAAAATAAAPGAAPAAAPAPGVSAAPAGAPAPAPETVEIPDIPPEEPPIGDDEGEGDKEERKLVSAARVFGASEGGGGGGGALRAVLLVVFLAVAAGGGYYALEASGINVRALLGLQEQVVTAPSAAPESTLSASSEGAALLPRPAIDVQAEINFAALSLPVGGENTPENLRKQIAIITGYGGVSEEDEDLGISEEEQSLIEQEEAAALEEERSVLDRLAASKPIDAEGSRNVQQRLDSLTPSENLLDIIVHSENDELGAEGDIVAQADDAEPVGGDEGAQESAGKSGDEVQVDASKKADERRKTLGRAAKLYAEGRYTEAEAAYKNVLRGAPANLDALRGMALIATATRRYKLAAESYLRILKYFPKDPFAVAELSNLGGANLDPFESERILKSLLGEAPEIDGRLYFSLGNIYAGQQRFLDAQSAYFDALSREDNPDYAYNLAVTLDYLNKPKLAARYYRDALHLAKDFATVGFSRSEVERRITEIDG